MLAEGIALKGGTAINLTIFNLPRLSVDIDLDYCRSIDRDDMLANREIITERISKYMAANGYILSTKTKNYHALDSFVYEYVNTGGVKDNIKIEINYMLRCHVLPVARRFVLKDEQLGVRDYLASILIPTKKEKMFWRAFAEGNYYPEWVFGQTQELKNISKHPMALWKCRDKSKDEKPFVPDKRRASVSD